MCVRATYSPSNTRTGRDGNVLSIAHPQGMWNWAQLSDETTDRTDRHISEAMKVAGPGEPSACEFLREARQADPGAVQFWKDHYAFIGHLGGLAAVEVHGRKAHADALQSTDVSERQLARDKPYDANKGLWDSTGMRAMQKLSARAHGRKAHNTVMESKDDDERRSAEEMTFELYQAYWNGIGTSANMEKARAAQGKSAHAAALQAPELSALVYAHPYSTNSDFWFSRTHSSMTVKLQAAKLEAGVARRASAETAFREMTEKFAKLIWETYSTSAPEELTVSSVETVLIQSNANGYAQKKGNLKEGCDVMRRHMRELDLTTVLTLNTGPGQMHVLPTFALKSSTENMTEFVRRTSLHQTFFQQGTDGPTSRRIGTQDRTSDPRGFPAGISVC